MICRICNANIPDGADFCSVCGSKVEFGGVNGNAKPQGFKNVSSISLGANAGLPPVNPQAAAGAAQQASPPFEKDGAKKGSKKKKGVIIGVIAAVLAVSVVGAAVIGVFFKSPKDAVKKAPFIYAADDELYAFKEISEKAEPFMICDDYSGGFRMSENNKYIVYCVNEERGDEYGYTYDLYYKEMFNKKDEGTLLARGISSLDNVVGNIDTVYYTKNGSIYATDTKGNNRKLFADGRIAAFSDDNSKMLVTASNKGEEEFYSYRLHIIDLKTEKVQTISKKVNDYCYNSSLSKIAFIENDSLYIGGFGVEKQKISGKVNDDYGRFYMQNDKLYYLEDSYEASLIDFVEDDCAQADSEMKEPEWRDYSPDWDDFKPKYDDYLIEEYFEDIHGTLTRTDYDAYDAAYEKAEEAYEQAEKKADEEYEKAMQIYNEAQDRNDLRSELEDSTWGFTEYALYCYDGESVMIDEHIDSLYSIASDGKYGDAPVFAEKNKTPLKEIPKLNIHKIESVGDVETYVSEKMGTDVVSISGKKTTLFYQGEENKDVDICFYNSTSKEYIVGERDIDREDQTCSLYSVPLNSSFDKATLLCDDCAYYVCIGGKVGYYNEVNEKAKTATLNYDGNKIIDTDGKIFTQKDNKSVFYYETDYNSKTYEATMWKYSNGKSEKIADDVGSTNSCFAVVDGKYLYITDVDTDEYCGDLYCKDGDKTYKIDNDVKCLYNTNVFKEDASFMFYAYSEMY